MAAIIENATSLFSGSQPQATMGSRPFVLELAKSPSAPYWTLGALLAGWIIYFQILQSNPFKAEYVGFRSRWEPRMFVAMRFLHGARAQITEGYQKYKKGLLKDGIFKFARNDSDILVIPNKYVEELRSLPDEKLSAIGAHVKNLMGRYGTTDILLDSDLHTRMLQSKLTPKLDSFIGVVESELDFSLDIELPKGLDDWVEVNIYDTVLRIVARISARIFLGQPHCRNEEWLQTSIKYTENVFSTIMVLRALPQSLHPIVAPMLPSWWRIRANLATAKRIIGPIIKERRAKEAENDPDYETPNDMLQWMMDGADGSAPGQEGDPDKLAHRQLILSLAAIHTTTMQTAHTFYDLCARPEYFAPLRQEIHEVLEQDPVWTKSTLNKLRKLDSVLKESQRVNPPALIAFNRIAREQITLSDGIQIPKGTHFSMASAAILQDEDVMGEDVSYDGFRYYKKRLAADEGNKHQFAMTDSDNLHFGHGKYSCPGRFFASNEIKLIMSHLLMDYEYKYPLGATRPLNMTADENIYPDPDARLLMRRRKTTPEKDAATAKAQKEDITPTPYST